MSEIHVLDILTDSKRQLEALFHSMLEGVVVQDSTGKVIQYNPSALQILGLTADQLLGKTSYDPKWRAFTEDLLPCPGDMHPASVALKTGKTQKNKIIGVHDSKGCLKWVSVTAVPLFKNQETKPYQVLVTFTDITREKTAKEQLILKEKELLKIINSLPALIGYWDYQQKNVHSNNAYSEYFGKSPEQIKGKHIRELLGEEVYKKNLPYIHAVLAGQPQTFERELLLPNGTKKQTLATYLPDIVNNKIMGFFVVVTDISQLKELENERREFEAKLITATKMAALGEMAGGVAHEINNPLSVVKAKASILQMKIASNDLDTALFKTELEKIESNADRIAKIIRALLAFSRKSDDTHKTPYDLQQILNETLDLCHEKMKLHGIEIRLQSGGPLTIHCRPSEISQILLNLLNNAYDAIEKCSEKWIQISVQHTVDKVTVSVMDSGPGITPEVADKMMAPFFTTKEIGKGTGLGLSISKGLAKSHGGKLTYTKVNNHTCFILELPLGKT